MFDPTADLVEVSQETQLTGGHHSKQNVVSQLREYFDRVSESYT